MDETQLTVHHSRNNLTMKSTGGNWKRLGEMSAPEVSLSSASSSYTKYRNGIFSYAREMLRSDSARANPQLATDLQYLFPSEDTPEHSELNSGAIYLPNFFCPSDNYDILQGLIADLKSHEKNNQMIQWSKHLKHENPEFSSVFNQIVRQMSDHFNVDVFATRLNFYPDGNSWKPFHHDSHAYITTEANMSVKEDFTMGASFGSSRKLSFLHTSSREQFEFPQNNGDVFAFDSEVNERFQHGVPKLRGDASRTGPRISIIAWGRRRRCGESADLPKAVKKNATDEKTDNHNVAKEVNLDDISKLFSDKAQISSTLENKSTLKDRLKSRKSRVQGGWAK